LILNAGFEFRQPIIIDKGIQSVAGRKTSTYQMFPTVTEDLWFYRKDAKPYVRRFLKTHQRKMRLTAKQINTQLGVKTNGGGMWSIFTGDNIMAQFPTEEMWERLQKILGFDDLPYKKIAPTFNIIPGLTNVWSDIDFYHEKRIHPTQKPESLIGRIVQSCSNKGDMVLDPFSGSGTTAVVCQGLGRNFICFEKDEDYHKKSLERLNGR